MVLVEEKKKCCRTCKGCVYNGTSYDSGKKWVNPEDPCEMFHCLAGVVTVSRQQCYSTCKHPKPPLPGQCCPSCEGCHFSGTEFRDGDEFVLESDRCVQCKCRSGNRVCTKQVCPVLSCPSTKIIHKPNTCCPECQGSREVYDIPKRCMFDNRMLLSGHQFKVDNCTSCTCNGSTSVCKRESCTPLACALEMQIIPDGECCPQCIINRGEFARECVVGRKKYKEGETWRPRPCTSCKCLGGMPLCLLDQCNRKISCPVGYKVDLPPGTCCPRCIEEEGAVCTVFGDPHYRTFDRRVYNFQGSCKYVLTEDCSTKLFSIRVRNDHRNSRLFSWTKSVLFKINGTKVALLQRMKVKVDGNRVNLPYNKKNVLSVTQEGYTVTVKTEIGVSIVWDGDSFLEVSVPSKFKKKLCGLCGNYNNDSSDEFLTRKGRLAPNAAAFGRSWQIGGKRYCGRVDMVTSQELTCPKTDEVRSKGSKLCAALRSSIFQPCHQLVSPHRYITACILDMCHCPQNKSCFCESFTAYAHECARKGVTLNWREATKCTGPACKKGAVYNPCGSACPITCSNQTSSNQECPVSSCVPGCHCPVGTVLHRGRCITANDCPVTTSQTPLLLDSTTTPT
ncbi:hypothetical protein CHUAL_000453 [Chamberlinius hualienensis]